MDRAMTPKFCLLAVGSAMLVALAGCERAADTINPPELHVTKAYVRLANAPDKPSALYFTVNGGDQDTRLADIITPAALRSELHTSKRDAQGMIAMAELDFVDIPRSKSVEFKPGGMHVMVWGVRDGAIKADRFPVTFVFTNGDNIVFDANFVKPGQSKAAAAPDKPVEEQEHDGMTTNQGD